MKEKEKKRGGWVGGGIHSDWEIELTFHSGRRCVVLPTGAKGTAVIKFIKTRTVPPVIRERR